MERRPELTIADAKATIERLYKELRRFPKIPELAVEWYLPEYKVSKTLSILADEGWLIRRGNWYRFPQPSREEEAGMTGGTHHETPEQVEIVQPTIVEKSLPQIQIVELLKGAFAGLFKAPNPNRVKKDWPLISVKLAMVVVSLGAIILSAYYSYLWARTFLDTFLAALLSTTVVVFCVFVFEAVLICWSNRQFGSALGLIVLWSIAVTYSITSTLGGQYNSWVAEQSLKAKASVTQKSSQRDLILIRANYKTAEDQETELKLKVDGLQKLANTYSDAKTRNDYGATWYKTQDNLEAAEKALAKARKDKTDALTAETELLKKVPEAETTGPGDLPDAFGWLATTFKTSREMAQFWVNLFPAVFMDVIAPAALAVAMFLQRKIVRKKPWLLRFVGFMFRRRKK